MEQRYQGRLDMNMMVKGRKYKRNPLHRSFEDKSAETTMNTRQIFQRHFDVHYFVANSQTWVYGSFQ